VPCGFGASVVLEVGSCFAAVCGRCTLLAGLSFFFFDALLASFLDGFAGGRIGVTSGKSSANAPRPPGVFPMSNHRKTASFRSSIDPQPARPKLADMAIRTSATRAQARIETLVI
jgi:hypothetical protein